MLKLYTSFVFLFFLLFFNSKAANEFYIQDGAIVSINNQAGSNGDYNSSDMPTLYIGGTLTNLNTSVTGKGLFNNGGEIQLTGDWVNTAGGYSSTGDEIFVGNATQRLSGDFTSTNSPLYNLIIQKTANTLVELNTDTRVNNSIKFGAGGRIRTDVFSHGTDGSAYSRKIYLASAVAANLSGHNTTGNDKYIEGKFERAVSGANKYYFPIGVAPASWDGMEPFELDFTSATASVISSYVYPKNISLIGENVFFYYDPAGYYDLAIIDCELPLQWTINSTGGTFNYKASFFPGNAVETCNWDNAYGFPVSFVAKDGLIGNVLRSAAPFPFKIFGSGFITQPTLYTLSNLTTFSDFTIPGREDPVILPIELLSFEAYPVNNSYLELKWVTSSEVNNDRFEIQRSIDGINFEPIGYVDGMGTTNIETTYLYQDKNVISNVLYYYRLKQIDFDGSSSFSNVASSQILGNQTDIWTVSDFFPNPAYSSSNLNIQTPTEVLIEYTFYDLLGRIIERKMIPFSKGNHLLDINLDLLSDGVYFLSLANKDAHYQRKLIKAKGI